MMYHFFKTQKNTSWGEKLLQICVFYVGYKKVTHPSCHCPLSMSPFKLLIELKIQLELTMDYKMNSFSGLGAGRVPRPSGVRICYVQPGRWVSSQLCRQNHRYILKIVRNPYRYHYVCFLLRLFT